MFWTKVSESTRTLLYSAFVLGLAVTALVFAANFSKTDASGGGAIDAKMSRLAAPAATFNADAPSLGAIADATACGPTPGTPTNVTFTTSGLSGNVATVAVSMTFGSPNHTWMGDIVATLIAPNGASHTIFGVVTSTTATGIGDSSDLGGTYVFTDTAAAPPSGGWWQEANTQAAAGVMTPGTYRTTALGGGGQTNPAPPTTMNPSFTGVANANGTWTLRLTDGCTGDTGNITAANLTLTTAVTVPKSPVDFNGDGKTDFSVVRNTGGGPGGQITWFNQQNGSGAITGYAWGLATDFFVPSDFDGDGKTDIAVWRPGAATVASFYILQSNGFTLRQEAFGQTGDDPTVVADYDGDGKADLAVYRGGVNAGDPSTWYYRTAPNGAVTFVPWGQNGDFPAPGDYDGDGKADFVVQRNTGGGQARFWERFATGSTNSVVFGTPTDVIVPGDYDGDSKTDIAVVRASGGAFQWYVLPSSTGIVSGSPFATFGASATDSVAQGDYNGDGKTDVAIWRQDINPGVSAFWYQTSGAGAVSVVQWGQSGDYPVANYNSH